MKSKVLELRDNILDYIFGLLTNNSLSIEEINQSIFSKIGYALFIPTLKEILHYAESQGYIEYIFRNNLGTYSLTTEGKTKFSSINVFWLTHQSTSAILNSAKTQTSDSRTNDTDFVLHFQGEHTFIEIIFDKGPTYVSPDNLEQIGVFEDRPLTNIDSEKEKAKATLYNFSVPKKKKKEDEVPPLLSMDDYSIVKNDINDDAFELVEEKEDFTSFPYDKQTSMELYIDDSQNNGKIEKQEKKVNLQDFLQSIDSTDPYKPVLDEIFITETSNSNIKDEEIPSSIKEKRILNYNDLAAELAAFGYELKPYCKRSEKKYYYSNFYLTGKILRDTSSYGIIYLLAALLGCYFGFKSSTSIGFLPYLYGALIMLVFPLVAWIRYFINPQRRAKTNFNSGMTIGGLSMIFINLAVIIVIIGFLIVRVNIDNIESMVLPILYPIVLLFYLPVCSCIYSILYHTKKYLLK